MTAHTEGTIDALYLVQETISDTDRILTMCDVLRRQVPCTQSAALLLTGPCPWRVEGVALTCHHISDFPRWQGGILQDRSISNTDVAV